MSEVKKLYELADIKPILICDNGYTTINCHYSPKDCGFKCNTKKIYPDFTVGTQLELIKWLAKLYEVSINWLNHYNSYRLVIRDYRFNGRRNHSVCLNDVNLKETLAAVINKIWQDLSESEKAEIKRILENE